jgi:hypothetical protein
MNKQINLANNYWFFFFSFFGKGIGLSSVNKKEKTRQ